MFIFRKLTVKVRMMKLPGTFYLSNDVCDVARSLLGKVLFTKVSGLITAGIIVETEAYSYREKACHAYSGRRTKRTETLFLEGSTAYVYLCYGRYYLFNVVTNEKEIAEAVLIRALEPWKSIDIMLERRKMTGNHYSITSGPGKLSIAMGIDESFNRQPLTGDVVWIEDRGILVPFTEIVETKRVGVDYAGKDAELPWRYYIKGNKWVSRQ